MPFNLCARAPFKEKKKKVQLHFVCQLQMVTSKLPLDVSTF